ncbi:hypothetical protein CK503_10790 [Aliifodinibius salipaludis]|uniref:Collagen-like protein n=1 Tax=Fodinibius salipaludis TaxID=2032627 RepID=A0A2A2G9V1_9BACT|nr:collagen-like protein [Aliifodinibius salipaludis]PAU93633.1 hypothetical protein CK503_10790 [Aliifodinibius salipaludis]
MKRITRIVTLLLVCSISIFIACEGPSGSEGPQGLEGPEGPVGPAGEDGSMMYSGQGAPGADIGAEGDYYINTNNGEMYGPKDTDGWGNPIMVLMGKDGQDGEDGSQIHAGSGAPDPSLGKVDDFYLDKANYDMYGPKTDQGWGSPINLKGADGNANVTRYIFPGYDFSSNNYNPLNIPVDDKAEMVESAWLVYLVGQSSPNVDEAYWSIPGYGNNGNTFYTSEHHYYDSREEVVFAISCDPNVQGEQYDRIEIVQIEASNNEDHRKQVTETILPKDLDTSNYQEVAEYYGFYQ